MEYNAFLFIFPAVFVFYAALELATGRFKIRDVSSRNNWIDAMSFLQSFAVIGPLVAYGGAVLAAAIVPAGAGSLAHTPLVLQFIAFLLLEDMVQYWWHRSAHTFPRLWWLHRAHHTAPYMGIRIVYRNGLLYGLLMPNLWFAAMLVYLGFGEVYLAYSAIKALVALGAHSEIRWDAWLYRQRALRPLAWLVERTISTPATHFAHHAASEADGIGHYSGNFGNLLFFWDVLFGTARITRRYPDAFGVERQAGDAPEASWWVQLLSPIAPRCRPDDDATRAPSLVGEPRSS